MNPLKNNNNCHEKDRLVTRIRQGPIPVILAALLLAAGCFGTLRAEEMPRTPTSSADAARLVEEVLRKAGGNGGDSLAEWTRSIVGRALDRAGRDRTADRAPAVPDNPPPRSRPNVMRDGSPGMRTAVGPRRKS